MCDDQFHCLPLPTPDAGSLTYGASKRLAESMFYSKDLVLTLGAFHGQGVPTLARTWRYNTTEPGVSVLLAMLTTTVSVKLTEVLLTQCRVLRSTMKVASGESVTVRAWVVRSLC